MDRLKPKRLTDKEIAEEAQCLYASADGRPASNHTWLAKLLAGVEAERAHSKRLEVALREIKSVVDRKFESYAGGDRSPSPPAWLLDLAMKVDAILINVTDD